MKKKILVLLGITLLLTSCGEAPKLKNGEDAVLSFKDDKKVSVNTLYEDMKDTYALSTLIDLMDRHVLEDKYKDNVKQKNEFGATVATSVMKVEIITKKYLIVIYVKSMALIQLRL